MNSGIYSLIARDRKTNEEVVLPIKELHGNQVRYKVNISSIDKLTTYFTDEKELAKRLYDRGYINFLDADIYIKYKYNNSYINLEVLYKDLNGFRKLITNDESNIELENEMFIQGYDRFFIELNNSKIRNYILNNENINLKLKQDIDFMFKTTKLSDLAFHKRQVINDLSNYRTFRNLTLIIREFYNPTLKEEKIRKDNERNNNTGDIYVKELDNSSILDESAETININVPLNYADQINYEPSYEYEEAKVWEKEGKNINEMLDLDQILSMPKDELAEFGINKDEYDNYGKKIYK